MKKIVFSAILLMGCAAFANAQVTSASQITVIEQVANQDEYKEVALTDLSEVVQEAVKTLAGETSDVTKVEFNAAKELTRVTLVNKENKEEKVVILDKEGKEVAPEA